MRIAYFLVAVAALPLAGCVNLDPEPPSLRTHYRVLLEPKPFDGPRVARTIGIRPFSQSGSLDREGIRYQTSDVEGGYFSTHLWSEPVATMVQAAVYTDLDASGIFSGVFLLENLGSSDLLLDAKVHRFEEVDGDDGWYGVVAITFEVTDGATGSVVLHRRMSAREKAAEPTVKESVRAIAKGLREILGRFRRALADELTGSR